MSGDGKLNLDKYGGERLKFTQDDIEDGDVGIVTIASFEEFEVQGRATAALTFEETGDKTLYLTKTDLKQLAEGLGEFPAKWVGKRIPVEKVKRTFQKLGEKAKTYDKVGVCPFEEWDAYLNPKPARKAGKR